MPICTSTSTFTSNSNTSNESCNSFYQQTQSNRNSLKQPRSTGQLIRDELLFEEHRISLLQFLRKYQTTIEFGLTEEQVKGKIKQYGLNKLVPPARQSLWIVYLKELFGGFGLVLWIAALLCFLSWRPFGGSRPDIYNLIMCILLLVVILVQGTFTFVQQVNSSRLIESFQNMLPALTKVKREGRWLKIRAEQLVPGDVIQLQAGDKVPADLRITECGTGARGEKSSITGESESIPLSCEATHTNMLESRNLMFCGSSLLEGTLVGVVYRTGKETFLGNIAQITMQNAPSDITSLQKEINYFVSIIALMALLTSTLILTVWYWVIRPGHPDFLNLPKVIVVCIISSVAFIPDGLPIAVTMTLTLVARAMFHNRILAKRLSVVETLGSATVIATDKTGTITQNRMTVSHVWTLKNNCEWSYVNFPAKEQRPECQDSAFPLPRQQELSVGDTNEQLMASEKSFLALLASLCNKSGIDTQTGNLVGTPTETALMRLAIQECATIYTSVSKIQDGFPLLGEISFTSRTKYHITLHSIKQEGESIDERFKGNNQLMIIKGAPEVVLAHCHKYAKDQREIVQLDDESRAKCTAKANERAARGERVLGFAYKAFTSTTDELPTDWESKYGTNEMIFFGLVSLMDPPRNGVREAVRRCHEAGVRVLMVTGDHPGTALAIAKMVEIVGPDYSIQAELEPKTYEQIKQELANLMPTRSNNSLSNQIDSSNSMHVTSQHTSSSTYQPIGEEPARPESETNWCSRFFPPLTKPNCIKFHGLEHDSLLMLGSQLDALNQTEWDYVLSHGEIVFARTTPHHKLSIVQQLQRRGEVVAVTGDGVNDAPALKMADIGIAMGIEGSEVSKEAANMVLLDDNFVTIVEGIREGRLLFDNLKKVIAYLLSAGSFSEILPVICHAFFGLPLPLSPIQMILICVGTDMLGAVSLAHELPESNIMRKRPRNAARDRLVNFRVIFYSFFQIGLLEFLIALLVYFITMSYKDVVVYDLLFAYEKWDIEDKPFAGLPYAKRLEALSCAQTGFFLSLVILQMWNLMCARTRMQSVFGQRMRISMWIVMILQLALAFGICWIPWFNKYLRIGHPIWFQWVFPLVMGAFIWGYDEARKYVSRRYPGSIVKRMAW